MRWRVFLMGLMCLEYHVNRTWIMQGTVMNIYLIILKYGQWAVIPPVALKLKKTVFWTMNYAPWPSHNDGWHFFLEWSEKLQSTVKISVLSLQSILHKWNRLSITAQTQTVHTIPASLAWRHHGTESSYANRLQCSESHESALATTGFSRAHPCGRYYSR